MESPCLTSLMKSKRIEYGILIIYGIVLITSASACSPFFIFDEMIDINVIFSVGKSFWNGLLVYRDLFEHKGPLMYAITALAALISPSSQHGIWVMEVIAVLLFLIYAKRTVELVNPKSSSILLPLITWIMYHSAAFAAGTAEEFCLPLIMMGLFWSLKAMKERRIPNRRESFLLGLSFAVVFWIKYSMIGFYVGVFVTCLAVTIRDRSWKQLFQAIVSVILGFLIITLPIVLFFYFNGALQDLFQVYFFANVNDYANRLDILYQGYYALTGTLNTIMNNFTCWLIILVGLICLLCRKQRRITLLVYVTLFSAAWFVYCGGMQFSYYGMILLVYTVFASAAEPVIETSRHRWFVLTGLPILLSALWLPYDVFADPLTKEDYVQFRLMEPIKEKDASLLTYGSYDIGFYTAGDLKPSLYHFCLTNCNPDAARSAQEEYIKEGLADYVAAMDPLPANSHYEVILTDGKWKLYKRVR